MLQSELKNKMKDRSRRREMDKQVKDDPNYRKPAKTPWAIYKRLQRKHPIPKGTVCSDCGSTRFIQRHHKDGNPENNPDDGSNLQYLCAACHCRKHKPELFRWGKVTA
jgi:5-methylcytosine-specific restriction endonuclease McrA